MSITSQTPPAQSAPLIAELRRCPTCNRWGGQRELGGDGVTVQLHPAAPRGPCNEGPWHGSLRGPRNACGQWLRWFAIVEATSAPPVPAAASGRQSPTAPPA